MRAAASTSSNHQSNHYLTDCLADSLTDSCAIHLNPKQDNSCEELARTPQSSPGHPLTTKTAFRSHRKSWGLRLWSRLEFGVEKDSEQERDGSVGGALATSALARYAGDVAHWRDRSAAYACNPRRTHPRGGVPVAGMA